MWASSLTFIWIKIIMLLCPICKSQLNIDGKACACENGHSFDIAKQGYVNLLPVNKKHSQSPGDSKDMVLSRRNFLESGKYDCFSDKLNQLVGEIFSNSQKISILDIGCGEGYYDGRLMSFLNGKNIAYDLCGFDISKEAVRFAAGKYKNAGFFVGSCFDMPIQNESFDLCINIFAPMVETEIARVLKKGGYLIYAVPGKNHLMGLKKAIYENTYENEEKHTEYSGFEFVNRYTVTDLITVQGESAVDLFKMTPYYYKTEKSACEKLKNMGEIKTKIHFDFLVYRKLG